MRVQEASGLGNRIVALVQAGEIVQAYDLEFEEAQDFRICAYHRAA